MGYLSNAGLSYFFGKLKTIFAPISHGHGGATQSAAGFMSAADKKKLDGIAEGANKYSLPTATSNVLGGVKTGANITNNSGVLSVTAANVTNALGYTPPKQDTNTWRPVVNNLTSSATDQSLAANQGKILNESKAAMIVLTNENLNDVVTPGFYSSGGSNSVTNKPSNVDHFGLIVIHRASGNYYTQIVYSDSAAYRRHCVNGTWSGWVQDKLTDTDTWRGIQNNLTSDSTTDSLSAAQGKALKALVDGKAATGHTHNSIKDIGNKSSDTTFAYSKAGMDYANYTWLACWNGYELRAVNKNQFATAGHTHDASALINNLSIGTSTPQDDDYYVSQYAGGGTTSTTYHRRPVKTLWSYIKGKGDATYQPKGSYAAANHTHTKEQVGLGNVDNTADANKSVKYATKAANADAAVGVVDYNATSKTIKIGYSGNGITGDAIKFIAGYTTGDGGSTDAKIKDVSKSALQSWLGLGSAAYTASSAYAAAGHTHTWDSITNKPSTFAPSAHNHSVIKSLSVSGTTLTWTKDDGTTGSLTTQDTNTTYGTFKGATTSAAGSTGLVIAPVAGNANRYLRSDGTWAVPPDTNTTYGVFAKATADAAGSTGLVPAPAKGQQAYYLRGDGTWAVPANTWRGIQDNLTSASTTDSLSANQGKVLKGLIDGKAASGHTHNYAGSSSAGGAATSANKVNAALTINLNGTSQGAWDGSSAKSISITAASVGATSVTISRW